MKPSSLTGDHHFIGAPTEWSDPEDECDHKMERDLKMQFDLLLYIPVGEAFKPDPFELVIELCQEARVQQIIFSRAPPQKLATFNYFTFSY